MKIGSFEFRTKKEAREFDRAIRTLPERVLEGREFDFARHLLDLHPKAAEKIGVGVGQIEVVRDGVYCKYEIVRVDGTRAEFSVNKCFLAPRPGSAAYSALRQAIKPQIYEFRDRLFAAGKVHSPISGVLLDAHTCHIDHHPKSFKALADDFLREAGTSAEELRVHNPENKDSGWLELQDAALAERWYAYHREHASLRAITKRENLTKPRK